MSVPVIASPPTYTAISALIKRIVALEEGGSLKFGELGLVSLTDISNDPATYPGLLTDMSSNAIVQIEVGAAVATVPQTGFVRVNFSTAQMTAINPQEGDAMRFVNRTLPGDSLSNEWYGIIQLNLGDAGPQFHIAPQESLKLVYFGAQWVTATGL